MADKDAPKARRDSDQTPSGLAAKAAGPLKADASDEEKVAWNDAYLEAKLKARRG
jgi:hypothetical protein